MKKILIFSITLIFLIHLSAPQLTFACRGSSNCLSSNENEETDPELIRLKKRTRHKCIEATGCCCLGCGCLATGLVLSGCTSLIPGGAGALIEIFSTLP